MTGPTSPPGEQLASVRRYGVRYRAESVAYGRIEDMRRPRIIYVSFELLSLRDDVELAFASDSSGLSLGDFNCEWRGQILKCVPTGRFSSLSDAEMAVTPYLRDWESWAELTGYGYVEFALRHWAAVDDDPTPEGSRNTVASVSDWEMPPVEPEPTIHREPPPLPPASYESSDLLRTLRRRFRAVLDYLALPAVEGYFLLTALEGTFGGRRAAGEALGIDPQVLHTLGRLTAIPDHGRGRKARKRMSEKANGANAESLSDEHGYWIVVLAQEAMLRLGHSNQDRLQFLTMKDLPVIELP